MDNFDYKKYISEGKLLKESDLNEDLSQHKLNTGNIYELPNGDIVVITIGHDDSHAIHYTGMNPEKGTTYTENQPYEKMIKNITQWVIVRES